MRTRGSIVLFVLMVVFALAAGAATIDDAYSISAVRAEIAAVDRDLATARVDVADIRAAEAAYLAAGQAPSAWMSRVDRLIGDIIDTINRREGSAGEAAHTAYDSAAATLADVRKLDARARGYIKTDQRLFASDAVFQDSLQATERLSASLETAQRTDGQALEARLDTTRRAGEAVDAAAFALMLVCGAVLLGRVRAAARTVANTDAAPAEPAVSRADVLGVSHIAAVPSPAPPPATTVREDANFSETADLCLDLARLLDGRDMPPLFDRAARLLDAKGLVLWAADSTGTTLRPTMSHGYPEKVVARIGSLQIDGENATALAFRTMQPQVVGGTTPAGTGALAVPLITASGCVGVLSAEVRRPRPSSDTVSVARLIAAQLSALIGTEEVSAARSAHG